MPFLKVDSIAMYSITSNRVKIPQCRGPKKYCCLVCLFYIERFVDTGCLLSMDLGVNGSLSCVYEPFIYIVMFFLLWVYIWDFCILQERLQKRLLIDGPWCNLSFLYLCTNNVCFLFLCWLCYMMRICHCSVWIVRSLW